MTVAAERWVDLDSDQPVVTVKDTASGSEREAVDLQFGPNNLVPHHGAEIWYKDGSRTCRAQNAESSPETELMLATDLAQEADRHKEVCVRTARDNYYALLISSAHENGTAPYTVGYTKESR
jgi:hypothetical protein